MYVSIDRRKMTTLPQPQFTVKGIASFDSGKGHKFSKTIYKREGYISSFEVRQEIQRLNKKTIELLNQGDKMIADLKKFTMKFVLETTINGKTKTQTIVPAIDIRHTEYDD